MKLNPWPQRNQEKVSSINYLLCFSHVERSKQDHFVCQFWVPSFMEKVGPQKAPSKRHFWELTWPPGGPQCDFWVPNGAPFGDKILENEGLECAP